MKNYDLNRYNEIIKECTEKGEGHYHIILTLNKELGLDAARDFGDAHGIKNLDEETLWKMRQIVNGELVVDLNDVFAALEKEDAALKKEDLQKDWSNILDRIKGLDKTKMPERVFIEKIIKEFINIGDLQEKGFRFASDQYVELKNALLQVGCKRFDEWEKEMKQNGVEMPPEHKTIGECIAYGTLGGGMSFIHQMLGDYETASFGLNYMLDGGEAYGWAQSWLRHSESIPCEGRNEFSQEKLNNEESLGDD